LSDITGIRNAEDMPPFAPLRNAAVKRSQAIIDEMRTQNCEALWEEIGLGSATEIDRVEILWPTTGRTQTLTGLSVDRMYRVREDAEEAVEVPLKSFVLPISGSGAHRHHHKGRDS